MWTEMVVTCYKVLHHYFEGKILVKPVQVRVDDICLQNTKQKFLPLFLVSFKWVPYACTNLAALWYSGPSFYPRNCC